MRDVMDTQTGKAGPRHGVLVLCMALLLVNGGVTHAGTHAKLSGYFINTTLPVQSPSLGPETGMSPAFAYVRADSVFLTRGQIGCPLCVGCVCILSPVILDSFLLAPEYREIPLQQSVRAWNWGDTLYFLAVGGGNRMIRGQYRTVTYDSTHKVLYDTITVPLPGGVSANEGLIYYGIDSLYVSPGGDWSFRVFGNRGLRAATFSVNAQDVVSAQEVLRTDDSLTITASGAGIYGTINGYVLDSALGYDHPVKVFDHPVVMVNDTGAVTDSGGFALREHDVWRSFRLGEGDLRDFRILRIAPQIGYGDYGRGAWGTHAEVWNDSFAFSTHFVKDDSTAWVRMEDGLPVPFLRDSLRVFTDTTDSMTFTLYDADANPASPLALIKRAHVADTLTGLWHDFQTGCAGNMRDTVSCLPWEFTTSLQLSWSHRQVRFRFPVTRGYWVQAMGELTGGRYYHFFWGTDSLSYMADTSVTWERGDTLVIRFPQATVSLVHDAEPISLRGSSRSAPDIRIHATAEGLTWEMVGTDPGRALWTLMDLRGAVLQTGILHGVRGRIDLTASRGIYHFEVRDPATNRLLWGDKIRLMR